MEKGNDVDYSTFALRYLTLIQTAQSGRGPFALMVKVNSPLERSGPPMGMSQPEESVPLSK